MLVLSRKQGESVTIDDGITVTVVTIAGQVVRLGIDAPQEVGWTGPRSVLTDWQDQAPSR